MCDVLSSQVLSQMDDLVDKIEGKRYESALYDMLRSMLMVYTDEDSAYVRQLNNDGHHGVVSIELQQTPGRQ